MNSIRELALASDPTALQLLSCMDVALLAQAGSEHVFFAPSSPQLPPLALPRNTMTLVLVTHLTTLYNQLAAQGVTGLEELMQEYIISANEAQPPIDKPGGL
jgi:hypothetical protein